MMRSIPMHKSATDIIAQRHVEGRPHSAALILSDLPPIVIGVDLAADQERLAAYPRLRAMLGRDVIRQPSAEELMVNFHVARMRYRADLPARFWNWLIGGKRHGR